MWRNIILDYRNFEKLFEKNVNAVVQCRNMTYQIKNKYSNKSQNCSYKLLYKFSL